MSFGFQLGQMVGPAYRVQKVLGRGGTSHVLEVFDIYDNKTRAMKCVEKNDMNTLLVEKEVDFLRRLRRVPGTPLYFHWFTKDDWHVIVTEQYAYTLQTILENHPRKTLAPKTLITILYHLVKTVRKIHNKHIIHRDIKPRNVMIKFEPEKHDVPITIIDFGLSMLMKKNREPDDSDEVFSDCFYATPHMMNKKIATRKCDLLMCIYTIVNMINADPFDEEKYDEIKPVMIKKAQFEYCPESIIDQGWLIECVKSLLAKKNTKAPDYKKIIKAVRACKRGFDPKFHKLQFLTGPNGEYLE